MNKEESCAAKKTSIGGQALIEGIMMRGPKKTAMAVRDPKGEIVLETVETPTPKRAAFFKLPFIRGIFNFVDSMKLGYKCLMRSAEISALEEIKEDAEAAKEEKTKKEKKDGSGSGLMNAVMVVSVILGVLLAVGLFIYLPSQLFKWLTIPFPSLDTNVWRGIFEGLLRLVIFICYMLLMLLMKDIRRTFMYHGAEHKTIFCYEHGLELTVENVRKQKRFHPRCGTSFMILMILVGIIIGIFINISNPFLRTGIKLLLLPVVMGIGYELIKLAGRKDNLFTRIISKPGVWMQHITTIEPDDSMIECAIAAMKEVIPDDGSDNW